MQDNNVMELVKGLNQSQVKQFRALAVPVLGEVRKCLMTGKTSFVVDLEKLPAASKEKVPQNKE
jgi:hypothetical protein